MRSLSTLLRLIAARYQDILTKCPKDCDPCGIGEAARPCEECLTNARLLQNNTAYEQQAQLQATCPKPACEKSAAMPTVQRH